MDGGFLSCLQILSAAGHISSVSYYFCIVTRNYNPLQFELVIHPHGPVAGFAAQHKLIQLLSRSSNGHFVASAELEA